MKDNPPKCKCGRPCAYYGEVGGYSKACETCNAKNAHRQRCGRARKKALERKKAESNHKPTAMTLKQVVSAARAEGVNMVVSLTPKPDKMPDRPLPGTPYNRTLMATDATDAEIKKAFQSEPSSKWVVTPTRTVERSQFMQAQKPNAKKD